MKPRRIYRRIFFFLGLLLTGSEIWKQCMLTFVVNHGSYDWWYFPFQLCSTPMYVLWILPWLPYGRVSSSLMCYLMCYGLLGGIAVFVDPSGLQYPLASLTVHSYIWHILLILLGVFSGAVFTKTYDRDRHRIRSFLGSTALYLAFCGIATLINHFGNTFGKLNMFYINSRFSMAQIGFSSLVPILGNLGAILLYILMTIAGAVILFVIWDI